MNRTISPDDLKQLLYLRKNVLVLDVRRKSDYQTDSQKISGAAWLDPDKLAQWSTALPLDRDIVVYCARGGSVSNSVVDQLQAKGVKARYIEGGFEAWKSSGGETASK
ncbi:MAG: sulfurtransferase [Candidatus Muproteobacteria bacterium RIFCSPHIGHO2_12_FULL_60_33]|uniref:Sulfurtransferase n=1 Tax=Candidatus Muproteobacteria bacterium RIFCSPLOWO2_01_FULL_60_18 TaxID=1817768 RepID=A0A1F6U2X3_9PROT|nr:MAG: sulfurtransferase [Candidatus Muproteobacteria bacterium RIFCSPHIGHO2_01_60_12]OGI51682.1 MAG: sulfurtransferase [Candidatus Muproteobacteria bacterium RIFCSPLOWO2_01_FULL_60_18]OGI54672.1 MAG: sulfurtransferase [Candidatus Muproteobacteria bacterium RIFCSPHIGHO2_02_FULL_60_13]OGI56477.1 MAG: sulfurtransferase [Candidatus Muproteobacteria bacterium RIFCSPHIGHO2_12_FULL_60_33]